MLSKLARSLGPGVVLLVELLVFFRKVIFQPNEYVIPWDFQYYHFNLAQYLAASLHDGRFPLWDPYTYCGMPFFAMLTAQVFYAPALLTALAAGIFGLDKLLWLETLCLIAHLLIAGLAVFWLLRTLGTSRLAALIGATAFQLGCYFASQTQHQGAMMGGTALPLSALAILKLSQGGSLRWTAVLAGSFAVGILTGFPSTAAAVILCTLVLTLMLCCAGRARATLLIHWVAGLGTAIALAAVQLFPSIQANALSVSKYRTDWLTGTSGIRLQALASLLWPNYYHILDLRGYNLPYNFTFLYLYCGVAVLALAVSALFSKRNPYAVSFAVLVLVSALLMHGDATPIGRLLNPYFLSLTQGSIYQEFFMVGFSFGVAVLAGLGADRFAARPWLLGALLLFTFLDLTYVGSSRPMNTKALREEAGITPHHFDGSIEILETARRFVNQSSPPARLDTYDDSLGWSMMAPTTRLPTANGDDPFALETLMSVRRLFCGGERWGRYYQVSNLDSPILDLLNVRYLLSRSPLPASRKYHLAAQMPGHLLYENPSALPRFFVVRKTISAANMKQAVAEMAASGFDPSAMAVVQDVPSREYGNHSQARVHVVSYAPERVIVDVEAGTGGFLVTSEANYPGWRATLDGKPAPIVQTNLAFRGIDLPAGSHRIVFRFLPSILWLGISVSAMALSAVFVACLMKR